MTGRPATRGEMLRRALKAVAFLAAVVVPMILFDPVVVYLVAIWSAAIITTGFCFVYCAVAAWWRYALGRVIFGSIFSVAALIDFVLWRLLTDRADEWGVWLGAVLWASLAANVAGLIRQLVRAQHQEARRDSNTTDPDAA